MFKKWFREIKLIGIKDWLWFVVYLKRNKFSPRIGLCTYYLNEKNFKYNKETGEKYFCVNDLIRKRERAHDIDAKLSKLKTRG